MIYRRTVFPSASATLRAVLAWALVAGAVACGSPAPEGASEEAPEGEGSTPAERAADMAAEHEGDRPEPSAAVAEPASDVVGDPVVYGRIGEREVTGYLARPADADAPLPGLLVIHEWWGLNDNIRAMARRLAGEGYVALAVDLYGGETAETPEQARELMGGIDEAAALENLRQAQAHLSERLAATGDLDERIGVIGWCFGGGWSLRSGLAMPEELSAVVVYYGHLITDRERLQALQAPVLGIFGAEDQGIPVESVRELEAALEELGKPAEIHVYDGAGHAFANPSGTRYRPEAAEEAWRETVDFLSRHLAAPEPES